MIRWTSLRFSMIPQITIFEPFTNSYVLGIVTGLCLNRVMDVPFIMVFLIHTLLWFTLDILLIQTVQDDGIKYSWVEILLTWTLYECLAIPIFIGGVMSRTINWKNQSYRLHFGGKASPIITKKDEEILI